MNNVLLNANKSWAYVNTIENKPPMWQKIVIGVLFGIGFVVVILVILYLIYTISDYFKEHNKANRKINCLNIDAINNYFSKHNHKNTDSIDEWSNNKYHSDDYKISFNNYGIHLEDNDDESCGKFIPRDAVETIERDGEVIYIHLFNYKEVGIVTDSYEEAKEKMNVIITSLFSKSISKVKEDNHNER